MQEHFPLGSDIKEGVSLICAVKNRNENLNQALGTWIQRSEIDEIIIVDWDSDEPVKDVVDKYQDGRIKIAHVPNQPKWVLSWAYNLAARLTSYSKILKLDADILLSEDFFNICKLEPKSFYAGNFKGVESKNKGHLSGQMYLYRSDFFSINGFDERITTYGFDEVDLYTRLEFGIDRVSLDRKEMGKLRWYSKIHFRKMLPSVLRKKYEWLYSKIDKKKQTNQKNNGIYDRKDIPTSCLQHIIHSDHSRVAHQDVNPNKLIIEAKINRFKVKIPWSNSFAMKQFKVSKLDENEMLCRMKEPATLNVAV